VKGPKNAGQSFTFGGTPLQNGDGTYNYKGVFTDFRYGYPTQDPFVGLTDVETEVNVDQQAKASLNIAEKAVVTNGGSGYSSEPDVTFPNNPGMTGYATVSGGKVVSVTLTGFGANIVTATVPVTFTGGGGTGAAAYCTVGGGVIRTIANEDLDALRVTMRVDALYAQTDKGDLYGNSIQFRWQIKPNGEDWQLPDWPGLFSPLATGSLTTPVASGIAATVSTTLTKTGPWELKVEYTQAGLEGSGPWYELGSDSGQFTADKDLTGQVKTAYIERTFYTKTPAFGTTAYTFRIVKGTRVNVGYYSNDGVISISEKNMSPVDMQYRIALPAGKAPWQVRLQRFKKDATDTKIQDTFSWRSYTEITEARMMYADTACVNYTVDSQYFGNQISTRGVDMYGRIISVPSNYYPVDPNVRHVIGYNTNFTSNLSSALWNWDRSNVNMTSRTAVPASPTGYDSIMTSTAGNTLIVQSNPYTGSERQWTAVAIVNPNKGTTPLSRALRLGFGYTGPGASYVQWTPSTNAVTAAAGASWVVDDYDVTPLNDGYYRLRITVTATVDIVFTRAYLQVLATLTGETYCVSGITAVAGPNLLTFTETGDVNPATSNGPVLGARYGQDRYYDGLWDGSFKQEWTDNPAWCFHDMVTHRRYGCGRYINANAVDAAALYQIGKYCDELVPDGFGGVEPRFTLNVQIKNDEQAYTVLNTMVSAFRGILFWAAGYVGAAADMPRATQRLVSRANVVGGDFNYVGTARKARHSVASVKWVNPEDRWQNNYEIVEDPELVSRFGYNATSVVGFGVTSRGLARRLGLWILDTEKYASEMVTYKAGIDHIDAAPGEIISIADPAYAGIRQGGRLKGGATTTTATMDAPYTFNADEEYSATVQIPSWGKVTSTANVANITGVGTKFTYNIQVGDMFMFKDVPQQFKVTAVPGVTTLTLDPAPTTSYTKREWSVWRNGSLVVHSEMTVVDMDLVNPASGITETVETDLLTFANPLPFAPQSEAMFNLLSNNVEPRQFRILVNKELDNLQFEITAIEHDPTKYARIENNILVTPIKKQIDVNTPLTPIPSLTAVEQLYKASGVTKSRITVSWEGDTDARVTHYKLQVRFNGAEWQDLAVTPGTSFTMDNTGVGEYIFGVKKYGTFVPATDWKYVTINALGKSAPPADVANLTAVRTVNGVQLSWDKVVDLDVVGYEIREGVSWDTYTKVITADLRGTSFYVQIDDKLDHTFHVKAIDEVPQYSTSPATIVTSVSAPGDVTGFASIPDDDRVQFRWDKVLGENVRYEIREGASFGSGVPVGVFGGTTANVLYPNSGDRIFWIKALSSVGLYSVNAATTSVLVQYVVSRNEIFEAVQSVLGWPGVPHELEVSAGQLKFPSASTQMVGTYYYEFDTGLYAKVRTWHDYSIAVDLATPTWAAATFTWSSPDAQNLVWTPRGDLEGSRAESRISTKLATIPSPIVEAFRLDNSTTGIRGTTIGASAGIAYAPARFADGLVLEQTMSATWAIAIPSTFNYTFTIRFTPLPSEACRYWRIYNGGGGWLELWYYEDTAEVGLLGSDGNEIKLSLSLLVDDIVTFGVAQSSTQRGFYISNLRSGVSLQTVANHSAIGAFTHMAI
jgi:predicted phage tail protein